MQHCSTCSPGKLGEILQQCNKSDWDTYNKLINDHFHITDIYDEYDEYIKNATRFLDPRLVPDFDNVAHDIFWGYTPTIHIHITQNYIHICKRETDMADIKDNHINKCFTYSLYRTPIQINYVKLSIKNINNEIKFIHHSVITNADDIHQVFINFAIDYTQIVCVGQYEPVIQRIKTIKNKIRYGILPQYLEELKKIYLLPIGLISDILKYY